MIGGTLQWGLNWGLKLDIVVQFGPNYGQLRHVMSVIGLELGVTILNICTLTCRGFMSRALEGSD